MKEYTIKWKAELRSESVIKAENINEAVSKALLNQEAERTIDKRAINWTIDNITLNETNKT